MVFYNVGMLRVLSVAVWWRIEIHNVYIKVFEQIDFHLQIVSASVAWSVEHMDAP